MRKWGPVTAVCLSTFMLLLDVTIVVVALPDMARVLGASLSDLQWVIGGYALALAALVLGFGTAADRFGRRRVHVLGVALFAAASLACGLAWSPDLLVGARMVQGVGAAAMFATTLPLLGSVYRGEDRAVALGLWGAVSGTGSAIGPILGGLLTQGPGWRWIFFVNIPLSVVGIWLTRRTVPESRSPQDIRIDWAGTATFALFAGAATYGAERAGALGWAAPRTLATLAVALLALLAFIVVENGTAHPLLDLSLFRTPAFVAVMAGAFAFNAAAFAVLPYLSIWLQTVLGLSPARAGLAVLPLAATAFVVAAVGGRLLRGVSRRLVIGLGLVLVGLGTAAQGFVSAGSSWTVLLPGLALAGIGTGLVSPALGGAALDSVPRERAGMAGGAVSTFRQLGYAVGVAVAGTILTSRMTPPLTGEQAHVLAGGGARELADTLSVHALRAAFASALTTTTLVAGLVGILAGAMALLLIRDPHPAPAPQPVAPRKAPAPRDS
ncbi:MFS transporter [Streptomyces sp. 12297]|uniref:MFS transporter n=1 Tax=Streptomyces sp. NBC_00239 TaxID=2903640 RepID=UPI002E2D04BE|nr:MFS transporter [Streptomyces sp. NBC_00239]